VHAAIHRIKKMENSSQIAEAVSIENELEVVESRGNSVIRALF